MINVYRPAALCAIALLTTLPAGCGYGVAGYEYGGLYRQDVATVAVPVFGTKSFSRGDEVALTQALVNQIEMRTPYKVVPRDRSDTIIEGVVSSVASSTISSDDSTSLPQEQVYVITVDFIWKDLRTGRVLVERKGFEQTAAFYPTLGEGRPTGRQATVEALAAGIVDEMSGDW
jgi:hypothetical protein